ncbi:MAG: metal ABC transporter permease [Patescibacteria group bacterium]|nr:metal ABC transporter permease [Patescibacteria group bacterium]
MDIFQYSFIIRGLEAGIIVALIAPLIGIFLVLKRFSLIADTLAHVSLAGVALGLLFGVNPMLTALATTVLASLGIERLRNSKTIYGESALALFLSGSLALAVIILSLTHGFNANLFNYLFGSIVTITINDVYAIAVLAIIVICLLIFFYKELVYLTFDQDAAQVSGVPVRLVNNILIILTALVVGLAIPIVGVLLIAALIVIPVVTALQLKKSFLRTIAYAEIFSLFSVVSGICAAFYFNLSASGAIVLIMLAIFIIVCLANKRGA